MGKKIIITEELKQQVKILFDQQKGARVISKEIGITRWTVQQVYKELGIYNIGIKTPRKPIPEQKPCKTCKIIKSINEFRKRVKGTRVSYEPYCLPCEKEYQIKNNPEKYQKNKEWYVNYKKINKLQINKKQREKLKNNPSLKLRKNISAAINRHLRNRDGSKNNKSCSKYLPYTIEILMNHLESKFEPWMNWKNWGTYRVDKWNDDDQSTWTWQVDHIIPAELFKYKSMEDEEFQKCWALSNLRPYSAKQNILDGTTKIRH